MTWWHDDMNADDIEDAIRLRETALEMALERLTRRRYLSWGRMFMFVAIVTGATAGWLLLTGQILFGICWGVGFLIANYFTREAYDEVRRHDARQH